MRSLRLLSVAVTGLSLVVATAAPASAATRAPGSEPRVHEIARFDQAAGEEPEGITVTPDGTVYVSFMRQQQLVRVDVDGSYHVVATLPGTASGIGGLVGLASTSDGTILGAVANTDPRYNGVWAIRPDGEMWRLATLPTTSFPNDLALTRDHRAVLVTDSFGGRVYRIDLASGRAAVWLEHALLTPPPDAPPVGANGITFRSPHEVVIANTARNTLLSVPVHHDGTADEPRVLARFDLPDGVRAHHGQLYVAQAGPSLVTRVSPAGKTTVLADAEDGLDIPTSLAIRDRRGRGFEVLVANSSFTVTDASRPGVVSIFRR
jgi:sugar lactone lactonase YvrE